MTAANMHRPTLMLVFAFDIRLRQYLNYFCVSLSSPNRKAVNSRGTVYGWGFLVPEIRDTDIFLKLSGKRNFYDLWPAIENKSSLKERLVHHVSDIPSVSSMSMLPGLGFLDDAIELDSMGSWDSIRHATLDRSSTGSCLIFIAHDDVTSAADSCFTVNKVDNRAVLLSDVKGVVGIPWARACISSSYGNKFVSWCFNTTKFFC